MDDYKPNSHRFKSEQNNASANDRKKLDRITTGKVKKPSEFAKLKKAFISEDVPNLKEYIVMDVLIPAARRTISDVITNVTEMLFGGSGKSRSSISGGVSYRSYYDTKKDDRHYKNGSESSQKKYLCDDVVIPTRGEAEEILERMEECIDTYGRVSVADFYDLADITCEYTDNNYGWKSVRNANIVRVRDGFVIKFPRVEPI